MYDWRRMSNEDRRKLLEKRRALGQPWHSTPHRDWGPGRYHLTAACYEHRPIIGASPDRMNECESRLLELLKAHARAVSAWCVLPNHYHLLFETEDVLLLTAAIGEFHGRQSYLWNGEDGTRGRKVWCNCVERAMRSERHFWATMNYVHHNPVHHRYVGCWQDWPYSSAREFLDRAGKAEAERLWRDFPIRDYGKGWDDPEM